MIVALAAAASSVLAPAATAQSTISGACAWPVRDSSDVVNVAFPDESAHYWGSVASGIPQSGIVIRGRYPKARYFSLHTYNATLGAYDALADHEIRPSSGRNPFTRGSHRSRAGGSWEVRVLPGDRPASAPDNTIYTGSSGGVPNLASILLYRVYVSEREADPEGSVGLPSIHPTFAGTEAGPGFPGCSITSALPPSGLNEAIRELNWPDQIEIPTRGATDPPRWKKFFGFGGAIADMVGSEELRPVLDGALPGGGFLNNLDNDYMTASISRDFGNVVVLRAKMPTFPDTRAGQPAARRTQLRYWSICQNHAITQRYVDCLADHETVLDRKRRATFVISDPQNRPGNAVRKRDVNWLPWGGIYSSGLLIYRQLVASQRFDRALALVEKGDPLAPLLGPYLPKIGYCTREAFEKRAAACLAD